MCKLEEPYKPTLLQRIELAFINVVVVAGLVVLGASVGLLCNDLLY